MSIRKLQKSVINLKEKNNVTILAHYYQNIEIQEIADYLGDSLGLSQIAHQKATTRYIIFAGVVFMAETASILNQDKHILVPERQACCPLADFLTPTIIKKFKQEYPSLPVVTYVNTTAAAKAESDVCCTSSNSINIVKKIKEEFEVTKILFGPDNNLAEYVAQNSGVEIVKIPGEGHCYVHSHLTLENIKGSQAAHPQAKVLVHPECIKEVREYADFVGSTAGMYNFVKENRDIYEEYIIGTEKGLLSRLSVDFPNNRFYLPSEKLVCMDMKKNELQNIKAILKHLDAEDYDKLKQFEIKVPADIAERALRPIKKMLEYSKKS
ncbi:MAG: Quinolinate synthase A [Promethearchaeota archaeon]|nr:MAG: Quinolinate synthase A [Candidatus Lokiarchaeota archaeon]